MARVLTQTECQLVPIIVKCYDADRRTGHFFKIRGKIRGW